MNPAMLSPQDGFTLVELLVVLAILSVLISLTLTGSRTAKRGAEQQVIRAYADLCLSTAEQRRNFLTNIVTLPTSCQQLNLPFPHNVTAAPITLSSGSYSIRVQGTAGRAEMIQTRKLAQRIMP